MWQLLPLTRSHTQLAFRVPMFAGTPLPGRPGWAERRRREGAERGGLGPRGALWAGPAAAAILSLSGAARAVGARWLSWCLARRIRPAAHDDIGRPAPR